MDRSEDWCPIFRPRVVPVQKFAVHLVSVESDPVVSTWRRTPRLSLGGRESSEETALRQPPPVFGSARPGQKAPLARKKTEAQDLRHILLNNRFDSFLALALEDVVKLALKSPPEGIGL